MCFVLTVRAKMGLQERFDWSKSFVSQSGVEYVRGCEVEGMLDENGRVIEEGENSVGYYTQLWDLIFFIVCTI